MTEDNRNKNKNVEDDVNEDDNNCHKNLMETIRRLE